jgi:polysaccharide deacetylase 2 family uncharacterized protein YibQ
MVDKNKIIKLSVKVIALLSVLLLAYQVYVFFGKYSSTPERSIASGQKVVIDAKTSEIEISNFTIEEEESELEESEENINEAQQAPQGEEAQNADEVNLASEDAEIQEEVKEVVDYEKANISVIVTELGLKQDSLEAASKLPSEVSFAFSPYSDQLQAKINQAKIDGREVMLNILLEPSAYPLHDEGPLTIQRHFEETENVKRFQDTSSNASEFIGYLTNSTEIVTHSLENIAPIMNSIKNQDKFFSYYRLPVNSYLEKEAKPMALDIVSIDYLVDQDPAPNSIMNLLNNITERVLDNKDEKIVIVIRPYPNSINLLKEWLDKNVGENFQIAPISYFVTDN